MAGSMMLVPYLASSVYAVRLALRGEGPSAQAIVFTIISTLYAVWLLYAGGVGYLLMTAMFYVIGLVVHAWARREQGQPVLRGPVEWGIVVVLVAAAVYAVIGLVTGTLTV